MKTWGAVSFLLLATALGATGAGAAEASTPVVREALVTPEERPGRTWNKLSGLVEAHSNASVDEVFAVITDWSSYPRLFPRIKKAETRVEGPYVMLSETVVVSAFGFEVTNRFTLRLRIQKDPVSGRVTMSWTQEKTDGTIDRLEGYWELIPAGPDGSQTLVRYRTVSAVPQTMVGQAGLVGLFFPGELKQLITSVLNEVDRRKEKR